SAGAIDRLMTYDFPGNVRELENLVEQAAALSESDELLPDDFPLRRTAPAMDGAPTVAAATLADVVDDAERRAIAVALERTPGDLGRVAEALAISPTTLWRKMKRLGLRSGGADEAS